MYRKLKALINLDVRLYVAGAIILMICLSIRQFGAVVLSHSLPICLVAVILDGFIIYLGKRKIIFSLSAFVSGLIISVVLAPTSLFYIAPIAAILSKHFIKLSDGHIFNPAAFGLLFANVLFRLPLTWWLAENQILVIILGSLIVYRIRKFSLVFSFAFSMLLLSVIYSLIVYHSPVINHFVFNSFFILFMLIEPKTSPLYVKGKLIYGGLAALFVILALGFLRQYDFLILGLLIANIPGIFLRKLG